MKTPSINSILRKVPVDCCYGAPMGASNTFDRTHPDLYVQEIQFIDGDYDPSGTYWGGGSVTGTIWCGFNSTNRIYVRGHSRAEAITNILGVAPWAEFRRKAKVLLWDGSVLKSRMVG